MENPMLSLQNKKMDRHSPVKSFQAIVGFLLLTITLACQKTEAIIDSASTLKSTFGKAADLNDQVRLHTVMITSQATEKAKPSKQFRCTGSLISRYHVLTAAHCVFEEKSLDVTFEANRWAKDSAAKTLKVIGIYVHPEFDTPRLTNDIAVLELNEPAPAHYMTTRLGTRTAITKGQPVVFAGYHNKSPAPLRVEPVLMRGEGEITRVITSKGIFSYESENVILLSWTRLNKTNINCKGDSGGPLFLDEPPGLRLIGVSSFSDAECNSYEAFTNILPYWTWVESIVNNRQTALLSMVAVPRKSVFTPFTSAAYGDISPATCENGSMAVGFTCKGRYCKDIALSCAGAFDKPIVSQTWSRFFSEEDENTAICKTGQALTGIKCAGRFCDNISIQCSTIPGLQAEKCEWSSPVSEEDGGRLELGLGRYIVGIECQGRYCDNKRAYTCHSSDKWTMYSSEENLEQPKAVCDPAEIVRGFACSGRYCDNIAVKCSYERRTVLDDTDANWSDFFTSHSKQGNVQICANGSFISGLNCSGRYCDKLSIRCTQIDGISHMGCFWTEYFSEENLGRLEIPEGFGAAGIKCQGKFCDDKQILICPSRL